MAAGRQGLLRRLGAFLADGKFEEDLNTFFNENACRLPVTTRGEEQRHESQVVYQEFLDLVESTLERFKAEEGLADEEIVNSFKEALEEEAELSQFVNVLLDSWTFDSFMQFSNEYLLESDDTSSDEDDASAAGTDDDESDGRDRSAGGEKGPDPCMPEVIESMNGVSLDTQGS